MTIYRTFSTLQEARDYRHTHGAGGWIFSPTLARREVILFPPEFTPSCIANHPFTAGQSGQLISD